MASPSRQILMPNDAIGLSLFYALMLSPRGIKMPPHLKPVCAAVTDSRIRKLMILIGPGSGKSLLLSTVYPAFALGQDPTMTILGLSAGEALMQGFQKAVMEWVEHSKEYHMAFPGIVPDKDSGWSTERGMYVKGRLPGDPDASYFAAGLTSSALTGKHARLVICDDLPTKENAATSET